MRYRTLAWAIVSSTSVELGRVGRHQAVHEPVEGARGPARRSASVSADGAGWNVRVMSSNCSVITVLSGRSRTISELRDDVHRRTIGRCLAAIRVDRATARRFLVRRHLLAPPRSLPAEPASVLARHGPPRLAPVRPARGRRPEPRPASWPARIAGYRRAWTDGLLYGERWLFEAYNKGLSLLPTAELPWYRITWDRSAAGHEAGVLRAPRRPRRRAARAHHARGPAGIDRRRAARGDRLVLAARPTRSGRSWRRSPRPASWASRGATATGASTTSPSGCSRPTCWPSAAPSDEQRRHKLLSRYRAHGLLGTRRGQPEIWLGTAPRRPRRALTGPARRRAARAGRARAGRGRGRAGRAASCSPRSARCSSAAAAVATAPSRTVAGRRLPGAARSAGLGPRPAALAVRLRLRLGGLRPGGQAALGLLRAAAAVRRPARRADRAADRAPDADACAILDLWWEDGLRSAGRATGFVDAFAAALVAHARTLRRGSASAGRVRRGMPRWGVRCVRCWTPGGECRSYRLSLRPPDDARASGLTGVRC